MFEHDKTGKDTQVTNRAFHSTLRLISFSPKRSFEENADGDFFEPAFAFEDTLGRDRVGGGLNREAFDRPLY